MNRGGPDTSWDDRFNRRVIDKGCKADTRKNMLSEFTIAAGVRCRWTLEPYDFHKFVLNFSET